MNITWPKTAKTWIIIAICIVALIIFVAWFFSGDDGPTVVIPPTIGGNNTAINMQSNIDNAAANITNTLIEGAEKSGEVKVKKEILANKRKEVEDAKANTNSAISNIGAVVNTNFAATNSKVANSARCEAFPNAPEC